VVVKGCRSGRNRRLLLPPAAAEPDPAEESDEAKVWAAVKVAAWREVSEFSAEALGCLAMVGGWWGVTRPSPTGAGSATMRWRRRTHLHSPRSRRSARRRRFRRQAPAGSPTQYWESRMSWAGRPRTRSRVYARSTEGVRPLATSSRLGPVVEPRDRWTKRFRLRGGRRRLPALPGVQEQVLRSPRTLASTLLSRLEPRQAFARPRSSGG
jgi:hypothetical protein